MMKVCRRIFFVLVMTITLVGISEAQEYSAVVFRKHDGLENELVKAIAQDQFGFIWIGTDGRLVAF